jgi:hypothetical protein
VTTPTISDIHSRVDDAAFCGTWAALKVPFVLVLVAAAARRARPRPVQDSDAFEGNLRDHFPWRISVEYQGTLWPLERVFYKLLRCQLVHEAGFVADAQFLNDVDPNELVVRAGGDPSTF